MRSGAPTPEDARTVALLAAIFLATDDVCRYLSQLESAVEKSYDGAGWSTTTDSEAVARARDLLDLAGGLAVGAPQTTQEPAP